MQNHAWLHSNKYFKYSTIRMENKATRDVIPGHFIAFRVCRRSTGVLLFFWSTHCTRTTSFQSLAPNEHHTPSIFSSANSIVTNYMQFDCIFGKYLFCFECHWFEAVQTSALTIGHRYSINFLLKEFELLWRCKTSRIKQNKTNKTKKCGNKMKAIRSVGGQRRKMAKARKVGGYEKNKAMEKKKTVMRWWCWWRWAVFPVISCSRNSFWPEKGKVAFFGGTLLKIDVVLHVINNMDGIFSQIGG